ncbi:hypothetical protein BDB01DRAFT_834339 [Pilobolus umbonatus]|nr:hypothetical protein BDB01DRAFT_834339 [Pilobolus umbonatus]
MYITEHMRMQNIIYNDLLILCLKVFVTMSKPFEKLVDIFISEEKSIEYLFTNNKTPRRSISASLKISGPTITEYYKKFRRIMKNKNRFSKKIGDESKSCKRKYHKGHQVKGTWIYFKDPKTGVHTNTIEESKLNKNYDVCLVLNFNPLCQAVSITTAVCRIIKSMSMPDIQRIHHKDSPDSSRDQQIKKTTKKSRLLVWRYIPDINQERPQWMAMDDNREDNLQNQESHLFSVLSLAME